MAKSEELNSVVDAQLKGHLRRRLVQSEGAQRNHVFESEPSAHAGDAWAPDHGAARADAASEVAASGRPRGGGGGGDVSEKAAEGNGGAPAGGAGGQSGGGGGGKSAEKAKRRRNGGSGGGGGEKGDVGSAEAGRGASERASGRAEGGGGTAVPDEPAPPTPAEERLGGVSSADSATVEEEETEERRETDDLGIGRRIGPFTLGCSGVVAAFLYVFVTCFLSLDEHRSGALTREAFDEQAAVPETVSIPATAPSLAKSAASTELSPLSVGFGLAPSRGRRDAEIDMKAGFDAKAKAISDGAGDADVAPRKEARDLEGVGAGKAAAIAKTAAGKADTGIGADDRSVLEALSARLLGDVSIETRHPGVLLDPAAPLDAGQDLPADLVGFPAARLARLFASRSSLPVDGASVAAASGRVVLGNDGPVPWPASTRVQLVNGIDFGVGDMHIGEVAPGAFVELNFEFRLSVESVGGLAGSGLESVWVLQADRYPFGPLLLLEHAWV